MIVASIADLVLPFDIQCHILWFMRPPSLFRYARIHRDLYRHFLSIRPHLFNVSTIISHFFPGIDPNEFRTLQARTGLLISGTLALHFLRREVFDDDAVMDLRVESESFYVVVDWLVGHGYQYLLAKMGGFQFYVEPTKNLRAYSDVAKVGGDFLNWPERACIPFVNDRTGRSIDLYVSPNAFGSILDLELSE